MLLELLVKFWILILGIFIGVICTIGHYESPHTEKLNTTKELTCLPHYLNF